MDEKLFNKMEILENKVTRIEATLYGVNGKGGIYDELEKVAANQKVFSRNMYLAMGAIAVINFLAPFVISKLI